MDAEERKHELVLRPVGLMLFVQTGDPSVMTASALAAIIRPNHGSRLGVLPGFQLRLLPRFQLNHNQALAAIIGRSHGARFQLKHNQALAAILCPSHGIRLGRKKHSLPTSKIARKVLCQMLSRNVCV